MKHLHPDMRQRLKLLALIALFAGPMMAAWAMVEWRIGIPDEQVAHGQLMPPVPGLPEWPLVDPRPSSASRDWVLAYACEAQCNAAADRWWRMHRALGREAPRLTRLRLGGEGAALPGEVVGKWRQRPAWSDDDALWLIDPQGRVVLSYRQHQEAAEVLEDIQRLLRMNPQPELAARE